MLSREESRDMYNEQQIQRYELERAHHEAITKHRHLEDYYKQVRDLMPAPTPLPRVRLVKAEDVFLDDNGLIVEVADEVKVRIPASLLRKVETLIRMYDLAKLLPTEGDGAQDPQQAQQAHP